MNDFQLLVSFSLIWYKSKIKTKQKIIFSRNRKHLKIFDQANRGKVNCENNFSSCGNESTKAFRCSSSVYCQLTKVNLNFFESKWFTTSIELNHLIYYGN